MNPGSGVRESFSRDDRLRKRREFEECYASGVRVFGRHLQLFLLPARRGTVPREEGPRLGISVPRKVGNAATRNRVKRQLREIFRRHRDLFAGRPGGSLVVAARASAAEAPFVELLEDYRRSVERGLSRMARLECP